MSANNEISQPPHKRTGVWSSDTLKPKTADNVLKRLLKSDVKRINSTEDDEDTSSRKDKTSLVANIAEENAEIELYKLPVLKSWMSRVNMSLLLSNFNKPEEITEDDLPWDEDSLLAEIIDKMSTEQRGSGSS